MSALLLTAVTLLALFIALFALVQFATPGLAGNDGYYHVKMGYLIREEGLKPAFTALPHTILNEEAFYDHHLLYHRLPGPFRRRRSRRRWRAAADPGRETGQHPPARRSLFSPSGGCCAPSRCPGPALWALALFAISEAFLYRMSMPRAQSGSLLILVLGLHWLLNGRYRLLLPLGFLYVWFYNAFPLLLVMAAVYIIATWLLERRIAWQAFVYPAVGIGLGLLINPYFPQNVTFIAGHLLPKVGESATHVGNEWTPYRTWTIVENSGLALAAVPPRCAGHGLA